MSYVELKHLLADLALEATRRPEEATWAPILAAYGTLATPQQPVVTWTALRQQANRLGARLGWKATTTALAHLLQANLFEEKQGQIGVRPAFVPHLPYLSRHAPRLLDALWRLQNVEASVPDDIRRGAALLNAGLFFECHEYLEGPWRATNGPEKSFYHGIVQVAAAFYHYEKRNLHGARTLLAKGLRRLEPYPPGYLGINLEAFRRGLQPWMAAFTTGSVHKVFQMPYPHIEWGTALANFEHTRRGGPSNRYQRR